MEDSGGKDTVIIDTGVSFCCSTKAPVEGASVSNLVKQGVDHFNICRCVTTGWAPKANALAMVIAGKRTFLCDPHNRRGRLDMRVTVTCLVLVWENFPPDI